jgi:L-asparagine transporter-like permease
MIISITVALALPNRVYEFITTAGGLMLLYTWLYILCASHKLLKPKAWGRAQIYIAMGLLLAAVVGTWFNHATRTGFFISLAFIFIIGAVTFFMRKQWSAKETAS